jgi:DNA invertase Pin-like site-specific DNA recombinase
MTNDTPNGKAFRPERPQCAMNNPCAVLYGRLSKGDSALESHEARNLKYLDLQGFQLAARFEDADTSGGIPICERDGGRALMNRLKRGDIQHVVVAKLDRLGRNARDLLGTLEEFDKLGVNLHIVDFGGSTVTTQGHMGRFILTIFAGLAEWERNEIRDRTRKMARDKASRNELIGHVPFGFDCRYTFADMHGELRAIAYSPEELVVLTNAHGAALSKLLEDNPKEQEWIRWIAARRAAKHSYKSIADALNAADIRSKQGGTWQCGQVDSLLKSRSTQAVLTREGGTLDKAA